MVPGFGLVEVFFFVLFFFSILHEVELFWFILKYRRLERLVALLEP